MNDRSASSIRTSRTSTNYRRKDYNRTSSYRREKEEENNETIVDVFIRQVLIAAIIFVTIFMVKTLNNNEANHALNVVKKNINYNININKEKKNINKFIKKISKDSKINIFKMP